jgi:uncharacterized membrane protein (UPF0136 family)
MDDIMQKKSLVIGLYAAFVLVGGLIGFFVAHSAASLLASGPIAFFLLGCSIFVRRGSTLAYNLTLGALGCLLLFFGYRFSLHYQFMPAGMMALVTAGVLAYLAASRKSV